MGITGRYWQYDTHCCSYIRMNSVLTSASRSLDSSFTLLINTIEESKSTLEGPNDRMKISQPSHSLQILLFAHA